MERLRGFEVAKGYENASIELPIRTTRTSAGFDFEAAQDIVVPPLWKMILQSSRESYNRDDTRITDRLRPTKVPTGIKSYMGEDEALFLYSRSSNSWRRFLLLADGVGVVDSDFYESEKEDGAIFFQFINFGLFAQVIKKGDRIGQGVFKKYLDADEGKARKSYAKRRGGSGTT